MRNTVRRYFGSTRGATATEYAIVAGMLAIAITGAVWLVGTSVKGNYDAVASGVSPDTAGPNNPPVSCRQGGVNCGGIGVGGGGKK